MAPAEAVGRKADSDAHRKAPFGHRDHFARVAWHLVFLICSGRECHGRFAMSSRLGLRPDDAMFVPCVAASAFPFDVSEIKLVRGQTSCAPSCTIECRWCWGLTHGWFFGFGEKPADPP